MGLEDTSTCVNGVNVGCLLPDSCLAVLQIIPYYRDTHHIHYRHSVMFLPLWPPVGTENL